ncbi:restriction endonuclease subunit S [Micrococcus porci]|uniref:restriction endonuclease subunit S n=1 Tax=Micrococcus porci TaxID=2856555 RepID=UPI003CF9B147
MLDSVSTTYRRVQTIGPRLQSAERAVVSRAPWGPGRWSTIGESLKLQSGATLPATRRIPGGVPVYGANGVIGEHDQTTHDAARVTIGRVGAVGAVNITSGPAWISDNALIVKEAPGHVTNAYLSHALTLADLGRYASQSAQPLITQSKIAEAPLWIPSPGEAARMQETLMRLEKMRGVAVEHENRAQALFASLQSRACKRP